MLVWALLFCHCKTIQLGTLCVLLAVDTGAFLELGKCFSGSFFISVDLPTAGTLAAVRSVGDETCYILRGIAQEQTDFVGKLGFCAEFTGKLLDTVFTAFRLIAVASQKVSSGIL